MIGTKIIPNTIENKKYADNLSAAPNFPKINVTGIKQKIKIASLRKNILLSFNKATPKIPIIKNISLKLI